MAVLEQQTSGRRGILMPASPLLHHQSTPTNNAAPPCSRHPSPSPSRHLACAPRPVIRAVRALDQASRAAAPQARPLHPLLLRPSLCAPPCPSPSPLRPPLPSSFTFAPVDVHGEVLLDLVVVARLHHPRARTDRARGFTRYRLTCVVRAAAGSLRPTQPCGAAAQCCERSGSGQTHGCPASLCCQRQTCGA
jgi:hypothetical protein